MSTPIKLAILDDYQNISQTLADWSGIRALGVEITVFTDTLHDQDALAVRLLPYTIICTMRERTPLPPTLLSRLPALRLILTNGSRNASLPLSTPSLPVFSSKSSPPGAGSGDSTVEHTWALILAATKGVVDGTNRIQAGAGAPGGIPWHGGVNMGLRGKTLALLGFGRLGQGMLPVARAFGMKVLVWSPSLTLDRVAPHGSDIELAPSLSSLLQRADILSLHLVLSPTSHHLISAPQLALLKKSAVLVNTSRGGLVDTEALVDVLKRGAIRHAALDVFEEEPLISGNPFSGLINVTLTPHMAYSEEETLRVWYREMVENVGSWLKDGGVEAREKGRELV